MYNFGMLKEVLLGHLTRQAPSLVSEGGVDMVAVAINSAITSIQRSHDFEWNKKTIKVHCNPKGDITKNAVCVDTGEPVKIKRVIQAYGLNQPELTNTPKVDYISKTTHVSRSSGNRNCGLPDPAVIHSARFVYMSPTPAEPYDLYFEAVEWMGRLEHECDTNFLFDYGFDYLIYRSLQELNFYIKEDQRFEINWALLKEAKNSLFEWDDYLISPTETEITL